MHPTKISFAVHNHVQPLAPRIPTLPRRHGFQFLRSFCLRVGVAGDARRVGLELCSVGLAEDRERDRVFDRRESLAAGNSPYQQSAFVYRWCVIDGAGGVGNGIHARYFLAGLLAHAVGRHRRGGVYRRRRPVRQCCAQPKVASSTTAIYFAGGGIGFILCGVAIPLLLEAREPAR